MKKHTWEEYEPAWKRCGRCGLKKRFDGCFMGFDQKLFKTTHVPPCTPEAPAEATLPACLYKKHGSYHYVTRVDGKKKWTNLGYDRQKAIEVANELNKQKVDIRLEIFGRSRRLYGEVRDSVLGRDEYKCIYCGATDDLVLDHFIPYEAGGSTTPCNLVTACADCNARKRGMDPKRFLVEVDALRKHLLASILKELGRRS